MATDYSIRWKDRALLANSTLSPNVELVIERYANNVVGGPAYAFVTAYGDDDELWHLGTRLRQGIIILDEGGDEVWWGYLHAVTIRIGRSTVTFSLQNMFNDIVVAYTNFGTRETVNISASTSDSATVSESVYGTKQLIKTLSDATEAQALQLGSTALENTKFPHANIEFGAQAEGGHSARLEFRGWYDTLGWQYYSQEKGLVAHTNTGAGIEKMGVLYTANTISFTAPNKILDTSGSGLSPFAKNAIISVAGTSGNDGEYTVAEGTTAGTQITLNEDTISTEASGTSFSIAHNTFLMTDFEHSTGSAWDASSVHLRAQIVGSPQDDMKVELWTDTSGSPSAPSAASGIKAASDMSTTMIWQEIPLSACVSLSDSTKYWLSVTRSDLPGTAGSDYYRIDVDEDQGYASGSLQVYSGCTWQAPLLVSDLLFRVVGTQETTSQISEIVGQVGEFIASTEIVDQSGVETNQWRDGDSTALAEINALLLAGTSSSRRLMAFVDAGRNLVIKEEPAFSESGTSTYMLNSDGELFTSRNVEVRKQRATVGVWAKLIDIVPKILGTSDTINPTRAFIEEAEYFAQSQVYIPRARNTDSPWGLGGITEG